MNILKKIKEKIKNFFVKKIIQAMEEIDKKRVLENGDVYQRIQALKVRDDVPREYFDKIHNRVEYIMRQEHERYAKIGHVVNELVYVLLGANDLGESYIFKYDAMRNDPSYSCIGMIANIVPNCIEFPYRGDREVCRIVDEELLRIAKIVKYRW